MPSGPGCASCLRRPGPAPGALADKFIHALEALRSPSSVLVLFALSVPVWLFEGGLFFVVGYSFDMHLAYDGAAEMAAALVLAMSLANIGAAVPSSPGGIGLFEIIARETLVPSCPSRWWTAPSRGHTRPSSTRYSSCP